MYCAGIEDPRAAKCILHLSNHYQRRNNLNQSSAIDLQEQIWGRTIEEELVPKEDNLTRKVYKSIQTKRTRANLKNKRFKNLAEQLSENQIKVDWRTLKEKQRTQKGVITSKREQHA